MTPELICVSKTTATFRLNGEVQQSEIRKDTFGALFFIYDPENNGLTEGFWLPSEFQPRKKS